mgnify:CR=1 FL=1
MEDAIRFCTAFHRARLTKTVHRNPNTRYWPIGLPTLQAAMCTQTDLRSYQVPPRMTRYDPTRFPIVRVLRKPHIGTRERRAGTPARRGREPPRAPRTARCCPNCRHGRRDAAYDLPWFPHFDRTSQPELAGPVRRREDEARRHAHPAWRVDVPTATTVIEATRLCTKAHRHPTKDSLEETSWTSCR